MPGSDPADSPRRMGLLARIGAVRRHLFLDRRGTVAIAMVGTSVPMLIAVGVGVDMARLALARAAIQSAADTAVLSGAAVYDSEDAGNAAAAVALKYFDAGATGPGVTISSRTAQVNTSSSANTVTLSVSGTISTTFMAIANVMSLPVSVKSAAANEVLYINITPGSALSNAYDWNSLYMYGVPNGNNGKPNYLAIPAKADLRESASNCTQAVDPNWSTASKCNGQNGAIAPAWNPVPPAGVTANTPLAFMFVNMNSGVHDGSGNQYGLQTGQYAVMSTAPLSINQAPSQYSDMSASILNTIFSTSLTQGATRYSSAGSGNKTNCSLQIQIIADADHPPSGPPATGKCFAPDDPASGSQYANLSCNQMAGRTFMYWWNDMGAGTDDFDYKNLYYSVSCKPSSSNTGKVNSSTTPKAVYLVK